MPKVSSEHRDARRDQILQAALACFSRDGFHQTGMSDIVSAAGLSQGAIYGYFASKDDIILALATDRQAREALLNQLSAAGSDPTTSLRALIKAYASTLADRAGRDGRRVGVHGWSEALRNPVVHRNVVIGITAPRQAITALIRRGQRLGQFDPRLNADAIARTLVAMFQGVVLQHCLDEPLNLAAQVKVAERMLDGLRPRRRRVD